jgi:hypothetical protein
MISIRPLIPSDVLAVQLQPMQAAEPGRVDLEYGERVASGMAWTALRDGEIIACAGLVELYQGTALAWGLLSRPIGPAMVAITRQARRAIKASPWQRIEMLARADWPEALEWAALIGMRQVAVLRRWGPAAQDHVFLEHLRFEAASREAAR